MGVVYRTDDEVVEWRKRDPIQLFEARLAEAGVLSAEDAVGIHAAALAEMESAIGFAESSPLPEVSALLEDVYTAADQEDR